MKSNNMLCFNCIRDPYGDINFFRIRCGQIVNNKYVQSTILSLIVLNAIVLGTSTFDFVTEDPKVFNIFENIDSAFISIFSAEILLQLIYLGYKFFFDGWLVFDLAIIVISLTMKKASIVRALRVLRTLRIVSRVQAMKEIISCLFAVAPRMIAIVSLLSLILYIFSVVFTTLFKEAFELGFTDYNYFGTLQNSVLTLFQMMTLDSWSGICRQIMAMYSWAWIPFTVYVVVSAFIVVNLVVAVICDAIAEVNDRGEEQKELKKSQQRESFCWEETKELHEYVTDLEARSTSLSISQAQTQIILDELCQTLLPRAE